MIYKDLLLSTGGGIIDKNRLAGYSGEPMLFIGLGGTGIDCLKEVKKAVYNRIKPDDIKSNSPQYRHIQFLGIDSDANSINDDWVFDLDSKAEFLELSCIGLAKIVHPHRFLSKPSLQWFNNDVRIINSAVGANGVRQVGRLLTFFNIEEVANVITRKISTAIIGLHTTSLNVHIFTGTGGGTGSGCFLDICYMIKHILEHQVISSRTNVYGYFFLPDVNISKTEIPKHVIDLIEANSYAFMKELDYCMKFNLNGGEWNQHYGNVRIVSNKTPVDLAFIIDGKTEDGCVYKNAYSFAMKNVADFMLSMLLFDENKSDFCPAEEMKKAKIQMAFMANNKGNNYVTLGRAEVCVPYKEINTYLASKLVMAAINDDNLPSINHDIDTFIDEIGFRYSNIIEKITKNVDSVPIYEIDTRMLFDEVQGLSPDTIPSMLSRMRDLLPVIGGQLAERREICSNELLSSIKEKLVDLSVTLGKGPIYASLLIRNYDHKTVDLLSIIDGYIRETEEHIINAQADLELRNSQIDIALKELQQVRVFGRNRRAQGYVEAVHNYYVTHSRIFLYRETRDLLVELKSGLCELYDKLFNPLIMVLNNVKETFEENVKYMSYFSSDSGFSVLTNEEIESICNEYLYQLDMQKVLMNFIRHLIQTECYCGDEEKVVESVSEFFADIFRDVNNRDIDYYYGKKLGSESGQMIANEIYHIVKELYNDFTSSTSAYDTLNQKENDFYGICEIPSRSIPAVEAAKMFCKSHNEVLIRELNRIDSISVAKFTFFNSLCNLNHLDGCKTAYERCNPKEIHLFEVKE